MNFRQVPQQRNTESALLRVTSDLSASLDAIMRSCNFNSVGPLCCFSDRIDHFSPRFRHLCGGLRLSHGWKLDEKISESEMPVHANHISSNKYLFFSWKWNANFFHSHCNGVSYRNFHVYLNNGCMILFFISFSPALSDKIVTLRIELITTLYLLEKYCFKILFIIFFFRGFRTLKA